MNKVCCAYCFVEAAPCVVPEPKPNPDHHSQDPRHTYHCCEHEGAEEGEEGEELQDELDGDHVFDSLRRG